ncbi:hypothetical protein G6F68_015374 [Rhizopus microsporus]|nr:hypothetical protein G6F68_015374 [Rhizopus microsporus]
MPITSSAEPVSVKRPRPPIASGQIAGHIIALAKPSAEAEHHAQHGGNGQVARLRDHLRDQQQADHVADEHGKQGQRGEHLGLVQRQVEAVAVGTDRIAGHHFHAYVHEQAQHAQPQVRELEDAAALGGAGGGGAAPADRPWPGTARGSWRQSR